MEIIQDLFGIIENLFFMVNLWVEKKMDTEFKLIWNISVILYGEEHF